jgi:hypothetical protein
MMTSQATTRKNIDKFYTSRIDEVREICSCCGARYRNNVNNKLKTNLGITCYPGYVQKPPVEATEVKRVKTKNGWITFAIKGVKNA